MARWRSFGRDEPLQMEMRNDPFGEELGWGAFTIGGVTPVIVPATLYFGGLVMDRSEVATAGAALIQAEMVQLVVVSSLKWLTDRAGPLADHRMDNPRFGDLFRDSKDADDFNFNPFDLEWGLRWPSGHTASNFTLVSTLYAFYPNEHWIALLGYPFAMAVGIGMLEGDYHWFSDIVAGALIGHVIGWSIGEQFREEYDARRRTSDKRKRPAVKVELLPTPHGLRLIGTF